MTASKGREAKEVDAIDKSWEPVLSQGQVNVTSQ